MATRGVKESEKPSAAKESHDNDYDGDEFEKDDIVNMVEPQKPVISN